jgi:hypothetical protein
MKECELWHDAERICRFGSAEVRIPVVSDPGVGKSSTHTRDAKYRDPPFARPNSVSSFKEANHTSPVGDSSSKNILNSDLPGVTNPVTAQGNSGNDPLDEGGHQSCLPDAPRER